MYVVRGGNGLVSYVIPPATHRITGVAGVMVSIVAFQAVDPGSIPGPRNFLSVSGRKKRTTSQRFELWRAEPNRFLIYLLNHSDTMSNLEMSSQLKRIGAEV